MIPVIHFGQLAIRLFDGLSGCVCQVFDTFVKVIL